MRIQHNIMAMNAYRNYNNNTSAVSRNLEKLSSGYRINRAGDDAAGLAISEKMRAQITGLDAAQKNVKDGISLVKTAEGALQEVQDMMNRMVYLATQSANGTYDNEVDRANLQKEVDALNAEIDRIADSANFNGIKLLDGSLDPENATTVTADSAISAITDQAYAPKGASEAFKFNYMLNRPEAKTQQTNAEFVVSLDAVDLSGVEVGDTITLKVGDAEITWKSAAAGDTDTLGELATNLATKCGTAVTGPTASANNATAATGAGNTANTTANYKTLYDAAAGNAGNFIEIDGHFYTMAVQNTHEIKFTQVDFMGTTGEVVNPDYAVSIKGTDAGGNTTLDVGSGGVQGQYQDPNWHVQEPVTGTGVGSTHQARVNAEIDFSKLKDGDVLTVGDDNFIFKIGEDSTTAASGTQTEIDLSAIFEEESDLADETKQAEALSKIVNTIGANSTVWTAGSGGVADGVGTLTFQSLSNYVDDAVSIGGDANNGKVNMETETSVMRQFYAVSAEAGASTSFVVDPTKIKVGDTFTIDGKTFEFTDGADASSSKNVAIDMSDLGISGGLAASQIGDVLTEIQTVLKGNGADVEPALQLADGSAKYDVTVDAATGKITLASKDDTSTPSAFENRTNAVIELPTETTYGSPLTLQIGDTSDDYNQLSVSIEDMHAAALGIAEIDITTQAGAQAAVDVIKNAINSVSMTRGTLGATQNRLEHTANNLSVMEENIQDAESAIRDTDIAEEMMAYTKNNILVQSAQAMLAQANQIPQGVLQLLG